MKGNVSVLRFEITRFRYVVFVPDLECRFRIVVDLLTPVSV
jgi:hypothetical protein